MDIIINIDPFIMQLVIVPTVVIGAAILTAVPTKRVLVAAIVAFLLNTTYETWYSLYYYQQAGLFYSSWSIILPALTTLTAWIVLIVLKQDSGQPKETPSQ